MALTVSIFLHENVVLFKQQRLHGSAPSWCISSSQPACYCEARPFSQVFVRPQLFGRPAGYVCVCPGSRVCQHPYTCVCPIKDLIFRSRNSSGHWSTMSPPTQCMTCVWHIQDSPEDQTSHPAPAFTMQLIKELQLSGGHNVGQLPIDGPNWRACQSCSGEGPKSLTHWCWLCCWLESADNQVQASAIINQPELRHLRISPLMTFMYATAVPAFQVAAQAYLRRDLSSALTCLACDLFGHPA